MPLVFSRILIKIEILCSSRAIILGYAADLTFENDGNVDKYLKNIILRKLLSHILYPNAI
jgi:hypothetical protein